MQVPHRAAVVAAVVVACAAGAPRDAAAASTATPFGLGIVAPPAESKQGSRVAVNPGARGAEGEDFATARPIPSLPFEDLSTTCGFANDLEAECTFLGGAPDVVYTLTPSADVVVDIDVCDTTYDAAVHVYTGAGAPVACSDDACGRGPRIAGLALESGTQYYIVLDGWYMACGGYRLVVVTEPAPCPLDLPANPVPEGEPACADDVFDHFNGGCNDFPYAFRRLDCSDTTIVVAGSYGTYPYYSDEHRDTDWYEVVVPHAGNLRAEVLGAAATQLAILDGRQGCGDYGPVCGSELSEPCETIACETRVEPGVYWIFVATRWYTGIRCPTPYRLTVAGARCGTIPVSARSWGEIKSLYR